MFLDHGLRVTREGFSVEYMFKLQRFGRRAQEMSQEEGGMCIKYRTHEGLGSFGEPLVIQLK